MNLTTKAQELLNEWEKYKHVHYNGRMIPFGNVVDIEMEKEAVHRLVEFVQQGMLDDSCTETELKFRVITLERHLTLFKDSVTMELLKNGG